MHFNAFTKACAKYGRSEYEKLAKEIGKPADDVRRYSETFWKLGEKHINEFERHVKNIEKGEKRLEEIQRLTSATKKLIMMFDDPWEVRTCSCLLTLPSTHSLTHSLTYSLTHQLTHSPIYALTHPSTHSLTYSLTHSLTYLLGAYIPQYWYSG